MRRTAAVTGALLITATMLTACGGGSGSAPQVDAVAETWSELPTDIQREICFGEDKDDEIAAYDAWDSAIEDAYPDEFSSTEITNARGFFLYSHEGDELFLFTEQGTYYNTAFYGPDGEYEYTDEQTSMLEGEDGFLGYIDPTPDPCAD